MAWWRSLSARFSVASELLVFLWRQRLWWLVPMVGLLLVFGALLLVAQSSPVIAPFIYTLF